MSNGKAIITVGLIKKVSIYKTSYFPEPHTHSKNKIKVENLTNYATKCDFKSETGVNTAKFAKKTDLVSLKSDMDDLDIDKLKTAPFDLYKSSNVVENDVVKKTI